MIREMSIIIFALVKFSIFLFMVGAISRFAWFMIMAGWNVSEII